MYKLVIADDDEILLQGLTEGVCWEEMGIQVAAALNDGIHVEEKIQETGSDLLLTDIRMSCMDGLEVLERIHKKNPDFPVIMLSAYEEFSYVQKALKHGAIDYLLKPVDLDQLREVMERAKERLKALEAERREKQAMETSLKENQKYREHLFYANLLEGRLQKEELVQQGREFLPSMDGEWCVLEVIPQCCQEVYAQAGAAVEQAARDKGFYCIREPWNNYLVLCHAIEGLKQVREEFKKTCKEQVGHLKAADLAFLNGGIVGNVSDLHRSMEKIKKIREYRFCEGRGADLEEKDIRKYESQKHVLNRALVDYLVKMICMGETDGIESYVNKLRENLREAGNNSVLALSYAVSLVYEGIGEVLEASELEDAYLQNMYTEIMGKSSLDEAMEVFLKEALGISARVKAQKDLSGKSLVRRACEYLEEHFCEPQLRVTDAARYVGLSPNYFSKLFAEEMGQSFSGYLIEKRMREAQLLLVHSPYTSQEIAQRVGYDNPSYFSILFKKYTGVTVSQYKKNIR